jgi:hypothetical protein
MLTLRLPIAQRAYSTVSWTRGERVTCRVGLMIPWVFDNMVEIIF